MDQFFILVNQWLTGGTVPALAGAFLWGLVSIMFSPCHLASIPLIVGYVAGQDKVVKGRMGIWYAVAFTVGLFLTIAAVGALCAVLGRMLGDVGPYWTIIVGLVLIWVALDMLGVAVCSMSGGLMSKIKVRGLVGAFVLGLAYGILSGSCSFGFIAPILAVITIQGEVAFGILLIVVFAVGHCLPIAIAGSSTALVKKLLANSSWQRSNLIFRRLAGVAIGSMGLFFIIKPFISSL